MGARRPDLGTAVFKHRGLLLAIPAVALAVRGKPTAGSIAVGLPIAFAGEALRCCAVGFSGVTTRADVVTAPRLVSAGPYAHVRNPLYVGNFVTALGFAVAYTGGLRGAGRLALAAGSLGVMLGVYGVVIPHEERYLRATFGDAYDAYAARVPRVVPRLTAAEPQSGTFDPGTIRRAESRTFVTFGLMLAALVLKATRP